MTRPLAWLAAVRDHPDRPPLAQCHVLLMLALRIDWETGAGFASTAQLAADTKCEERTVRSATGWARRAGLLKMTSRGHRRGDGSVRATEWQLISTGTGLPVERISTGSGVPVETASTGKSASLNRQMSASQPARSTPPSRPRTSRPRTSGERAPDPARSQTPRPFAEVWRELYPEPVRTLVADELPEPTVNGHKFAEGRCTVCRKPQRLTGAGMVRTHGGQWGGNCRGSLKAPA